MRVPLKTPAQQQQVSARVYSRGCGAWCLLVLDEFKSKLLQKSLFQLHSHCLLEAKKILIYPALTSRRQCYPPCRCSATSSPPASSPGAAVQIVLPQSEWGFPELQGSSKLLVLIHATDARTEKLQTLRILSVAFLTPCLLPCIVTLCPVFKMP